MAQQELTYPFCTIGIDLGGTKIAAGLLLYEEAGKAPKILNQERVPTQGELGRDMILSNIYKVARANMDFHAQS